MSHLQLFNKGSIMASRWDVEICQYFKGLPDSGSERSGKLKVLYDAEVTLPKGFPSVMRRKQACQ